jgi:peptidoglycan hydrolase-like protein with peptidoglycan-binding domain
VGIVTAVVAVIAVTLGVVALRGAATDDDAGTEVPEATVAPERRTLRDVVITRGTLGGRPLGTLLSAGSGRVTGITAAPGAVVDPGAEVLAEDGVPVIAVAGTFPFWRELSADAQGEDVQQMKSFLRAEGHDPGADHDRFDQGTRAALVAWQKAHGQPADGVLRPATVLVAPWPARVQTVKVAVGAFLSPGLPLLDLVSTDRVVNLELTSAQRSRLEPDLPVEVDVDGSGTSVTGRLSELSAVPTPSEDVGRGGSTYAATVILDGAPEDLVDGISVRADIIVRQATDVLTVPVASVRTDGEGRAAVLVDRGGADPELLPITTGVQEGAYVEVAAGLKGSERIVLDLG